MADERWKQGKERIEAEEKKTDADVHCFDVQISSHLHLIEFVALLVHSSTSVP